MCQKWVKCKANDSNDWFAKLLGNCDWASKAQRVTQFVKVVGKSTFMNIKNQKKVIYSFCFYNSIACFIASLLFFFYKTRILNTAGKLASNERMNYENVASVPVLYRRLNSSSVLGLKFGQSLMTRKPVLLLNLFRKWTIGKRNREFESWIGRTSTAFFEDLWI